MITDKQKDLLRSLVEHQEHHGYLPSVREAMKLLRVRSTNTAQYHLNRLQDEGYLRRDAGRARAYRLTQRAHEFLASIGRKTAAPGSAAPAAGIPLLGRITAGPLRLAAEEAQGMLDLVDFVGADAGTFALRVDGDSMKGAGIMHGDLVIVRRQPTLNEGDIGVLLVDGETTVKFIHFEDEEIVLRPANPQYSDIRIPRHHPALEICGRVIGVVRRV